MSAFMRSRRLYLQGALRGPHLEQQAPGLASAWLQPRGGSGHVLSPLSWCPHLCAGTVIAPQGISVGCAQSLRGHHQVQNLGVPLRSMACSGDSLCVETQHSRERTSDPSLSWVQCSLGPQTASRCPAAWKSKWRLQKAKTDVRVQLIALPNLWSWRGQ